MIQGLWDVEAWSSGVKVGGGWIQRIRVEGVYHLGLNSKHFGVMA